MKVGKTIDNTIMTKSGLLKIGYLSLSQAESDTKITRAIPPTIIARQESAIISDSRLLAKLALTDRKNILVIVSIIDSSTVSYTLQWAKIKIPFFTKRPQKRH